jgi:hypothetical protein
VHELIQPCLVNASCHSYPLAVVSRCREMPAHARAYQETALPADAEDVKNMRNSYEGPASHRHWQRADTWLPAARAAAMVAADATSPAVPAGSAVPVPGVLPYLPGNYCMGTPAAAGRTRRVAWLDLLVASGYADP